jgi:ribose transport system permease protein
MNQTQTKDESLQPAGLSGARGLQSDTLIRYIPIALLIIVLVLLGVFVENFFTTRNILNILMQSSALGLMAMGMTAVLITGGIDLSIPAVMAFSAIIGALFMRAGGNPILGGLIMVVVGTLAGSINGVSVAYFKMIPFVVTLAMQAVATGASIWLTNQVSISGIPPAFLDTVLAKVSGVGVPVISLAIFFIIVQVIMTRSVFGRWLYATGTNARAARVSGIPTARVLLFVYMFSGFMAGLAAIIMTARLSSAGAQMGPSGMVLDIVASSVLGGVSIYGGVGSALNAVVGAILITLISNSMNMMQISYYNTLVIKGFVIIIVVALDALRKR